MARFANLGWLTLHSVCSLEHENPRELDLGYVLVIHKLKNRSRDVNPVYKELIHNLQWILSGQSLGIPHNLMTLC